MTVLEYIIGGILLVLAVLLIVFITLQQSKRQGLGNSIAGTGASESYIARNKIASKGKWLQKATLIIAIIFVILVLALFIIHSSGNEPSKDTSDAASQTVSSTVSATESKPADTSKPAEESKEESKPAEESKEESKPAEESK